MGPSVVLRAPAKLNLTLEVLNRREDGYHNLRSVMVPVTLYDEIVLGARAGTAIEPGNLINKALLALELRNPVKHVGLHKRIPAGGGMGGGSSDAAAILLAAIDGVFGELRNKDHLTLARSLGSDVPFFLTGTAAIVEGTGERVTALGTVPPWHATIVKPPVHVSTAQAYGALDLHAHPSRPRNSSVTLRMGEALQRGEFERVASLLANDFEQPIENRHPEVGVALRALRNWSGSPAILTGSGSCVFTLWQNAPPAGALDLPPEYERFDVQFTNSQGWRTA